MKALALAAFLCASAAIAQQDPTPFWMPPPPPAEKEKKPPAKKKKAPLPEKRKPPPARAKAPPEKNPPKKKAVEEPTWIEPRKTEPPRPPVNVQRKPAPAEQPAPPLEEPVEKPVETRKPVEIRKPVEAQKPAPQPEAVPQPVEPDRTPAPAVAAIATEVPFIEPEAPARDLRRLSVDAVAGGWGRSRSDGSGRAWDVAYGVRFGFALSPSIELDMQLARAAGGSGSPFVSATVAQNVAVLRGFYVMGDALALLLGGGGGITLAQTHDSLLPSTAPDVVANGLDAAAVKPVMEITAATRWRIFRGLEARAEVSALARDGKLVLLPLLGAGAAF